MPGDLIKSKDRPMNPIIIQFFGNIKFPFIPSFNGRSIPLYKKEAAKTRPTYILVMCGINKIESSSQSTT